MGGWISEREREVSCLQVSTACCRDKWAWISLDKGHCVLSLIQATNAVWIPWNMLFIALYEEAKRVAKAGGLTPTQTSEAGPGPGRVMNDLAPQGETEPELPAWALGLCSAGNATQGRRVFILSTHARASRHTLTNRPVDNLLMSPLAAPVGALCSLSKMRPCAPKQVLLAWPASSLTRRTSSRPVFRSWADGMALTPRQR